MKSKHQKPWRDSEAEGDVLDRALDAALGKYAAVEPRPGLEGRILAHLRSAEDSPTIARWRWSAAGAVAAAVAVTLILAWKPIDPTNRLVHHPSASVQVEKGSTTQVAANRGIQNIARVRRRRRATRPGVHEPTVVADQPKLDQFPSPEPLTTEELALVRYVREFPRDAVIVASAQEEFEKEIQREEAAGRQATSNSIEEER